MAISTHLVLSLPRAAERAGIERGRERLCSLTSLPAPIPRSISGAQSSLLARSNTRTTARHALSVCMGTECSQLVRCLRAAQSASLPDASTTLACSSAELFSSARERRSSTRSGGRATRGSESVQVVCRTVAGGAKCELCAVCVRPLSFLPAVVEAVLVVVVTVPHDVDDSTERRVAAAYEHGRLLGRCTAP